MSRAADRRRRRERHVERAAARARRAAATPVGGRPDADPPWWAATAVFLAVLGALLALALLLRGPWLGDGLVALLPSPGAQRAAGIALPAAVAACALAHVCWPATASWRPRARSNAIGLAAATWLVAPFGRGGATGPAGAHGTAPVLLDTLYLSYPVLGVVLLALFLATRRRPRRSGRDRSRPLWPDAVLALGIPTVTVAGLVALGTA